MTLKNSCIANENGGFEIFSNIHRMKHTEVLSKLNQAPKFLVTRLAGKLSQS